MTQARLELPDGQEMSYQIRESTRSKKLRLKLTARDGLSVTAPKGTSQDKIETLVTKKSAWIQKHLDQFSELEKYLVDEVKRRPEAFDLPAVGESWIVEYKKSKAKTVAAKSLDDNHFLVYGAVDDIEACHAALRRWLARHAKIVLSPWLENLSVETNLQFDKLAVKNQRTRWGSCSSKGIINLNCKLLFLNREQVRYVLVHELCHTLEANHSIKFWSLVREFEPQTDYLHGSMRDAWKKIPAWAHPLQPAKGMI